MSTGLDTSVVVRLLIGEPAEHTAAAWRLVNELADAGEPATVDDLVIAEAFFVLQHHYLVPLAETVGALEALVSDARIKANPTSVRVLRMPGLVRAKPGFIDRLIHGRYEAAGAILATFDKAASKLPQARRLG